MSRATSKAKPRKRTTKRPARGFVGSPYWQITTNAANLMVRAASEEKVPVLDRARKLIRSTSGDDDDVLDLAIVSIAMLGTRVAQ